MTFKQVEISIESIMNRKKIEMKFHAACLGATIEENENNELVDSLDDEQLTAMEKASYESLGQKGLKRYGRSND